MPSSLTQQIIHIVLIEGCRLVRMGLRTLLKEDIQFDIVAEADSVKTAMGMVDQVRCGEFAEPDVAIVDIGLPDGSGLDLVEQLRSQWPNTRFMILTSRESSEALMCALKLGVHAYCLKRIQTPTLSVVIKTVHQGAIWIDPIMAHHVAALFEAPAMKSSLENKESLIDYGAFSPREIEVLRLVVDGFSNTEIAEKLYISVHTAKYYVSNLLEKLSSKDRVQMAVKSVRMGLV